MKILIFAAVTLALPCVSVQADTVALRLGAAPSTVDLNSATAFAFYGDSNNAVDTDAGNLGDFTAPIYTTQDDAVFGTPGSSGVTGSSYTAASYSGGAPADSASNSTDFAAVGFEDGSSLSVTTNLITPSETLEIFLTNYNATSDLSFALGGSTFTFQGMVLPTSVDGLGDGTGTGTNSGLLTLTVLGSTGETLTFIDATDETAVGNPVLGNVGLEAITVQAATAPEPSTWCFLLTGSCLLLFLRRVRWN